MKLRLHITAPSGHSASFEHAGPIVRIGRDPEGELPLQGEAAHAASFRHARIDLSPSGALLADEGSSNGTLLNDKLIEGTVPLRAGDRIGLGHTGAILTVVELDLTPAPGSPTAEWPGQRDTSPKRQRRDGPGAGASGLYDPVAGASGLCAGGPGAGASGLCPSAPGGRAGASSLSPGHTTVLLVGAAVAGLLVLSLGAYLLSRGGTKPADERAQASAPPVPPAARINPLPAPPPSQPPNPAPKPLGPKPPEPPPGPPPMKVGPDPLAGDVREVGRFVTLPKWGPGVLLQRQGDAYPWLPLRSEGKVSTATTLVSLPGYRSAVALDTGVLLTLWGNLPEFSGFPPLLESVVMLNTPAAGFDLDMTLDRGRIHLANQKPAGPARVQVRFLRQTWELTLPGPGGEACMELWSPLVPVPGAGPPPYFGLFTRTRATLTAQKQTLDLPPNSRVSWVNRPDAAPHHEVLKELPDWWARPPDRAQPQVQDAMLALLDWNVQLGRSSEVIDNILTRIRESTDAPQRVIGVQFLAALDGAPFLLEFLGDRQNHEVRGAARYALQVWLLRRPENLAELVRLLQDKRGFSRDKAALVGRLLRQVPEADLARPETYQGLIDLLDHEDLVVRDLAFWHLAALVPEGAKTISYNPIMEADQRSAAVTRWRKLVPRGQVPRRGS